MVAVLYYTRTDLISRQGKVSFKSGSVMNKHGNFHPIGPIKFTLWAEIRQSNLHILPAYHDMYTSGQCNVKLGRRIIYFKSNQANGDLIFDATDIRFIQCIQNWNIIFSRYRKNEKY